MEKVTRNDNAALHGRRLTLAQRRELEADLREELARLERLMRSEATASARSFEAPMAQANDGQAGLTVMLHSRAAERYQAVVNALERMERGGYGICASCEQPIPYGRLIAMPESAYCVACGARA